MVKVQYKLMWNYILHSFPQIYFSIQKEMKKGIN